jgi:hypothetical protein
VLPKYDVKAKRFKDLRKQLKKNQIYLNKNLQFFCRRGRSCCLLPDVKEPGGNRWAAFQPAFPGAALPHTAATFYRVVMP